MTLCLMQNITTFTEHLSAGERPSREACGPILPVAGLSPVDEFVLHCGATLSRMRLDRQEGNQNPNRKTQNIDELHLFIGPLNANGPSQNPMIDSSILLRQLQIHFLWFFL